MTSRVEDKSSELVAISHDLLGWNLARVKLIVLFICALCKVQTVGFDKLSAAFSSTFDCASSLRRIQRVIAKFSLDSYLIACLIFRLLPHDPPYRIDMDRTNWKFGELNINVSVIAVICQDLSFPLMFTMLPKAGNSNTKKRIELVERFIRLFGTQGLGCLTADREFVGDQWIKLSQ